MKGPPMLAKASLVPERLPHDLVRLAGSRALETHDRHADLGRVFCLAVENLPHGVIVLDKPGDVVAANRLAETIFGYDPGQLIGQRIDQLLPESWREAHLDLVSSHRADLPNRTFGVDVPLTGRRRNGSFVPLEIAVTVFGDNQMPYVVASLTDATERLTREARLMAATTAQVNLQQVIGELATRFASVEAEAIDESIVDGLGRMAEVLNLDRAMLWRQSAGASEASHQWIQAAVTPLPGLEPLAAVPFLASPLEEGSVVSFARLEDVPKESDRDAFAGHLVQSGAAIPVPLPDGGRAGSAALVCGSASTRDWPPAILEQLRLAAGVFSQALARKANLSALESALGELHQLREDAASETLPRPSVKVFRVSKLIVSESEAVRRALAQVDQVAPMPSTVLLLGETGVGKEVFAQAIHELSARRQRPMVRVSCAAIPSALIESELFGRERGAYTGALSRQIGRFEAANNSTLFLDEIGELSAEVQVKLLRVLQERVIERLGSTQSIKVDVRIIAATNRNLEKAVEDKNFREDLFYRLNVFPISIPPLRERVEDIPGLIWEFVNEFSKSLGKPIDSISKDSMRQLQLYSWPGNVRELRNVIERAVIIADSPRLTVPIPQPAGRAAPATSTLRNLEIEHIRATLEKTHWRIRGPMGAAERLGLKPTTLETRMAKLGLTRPKPS
jgi:formate hydrogenlyase transcriptional activator